MARTETVERERTQERTGGGAKLRHGWCQACMRRTLCGAPGRPGKPGNVTRSTVGAVMREPGVCVVCVDLAYGGVTRCSGCCDG